MLRGNKMKIKFTPKDVNKPYKIPEYATPGSSGVDLYSANEKEIIVCRGDVVLVDINLCIEMPQGVEAQVRSRSGLALKNQLFVLNSPGTVDSDYRASIGVIIANFGKEPFTIKPMTKIAQLVFANVLKVDFEQVDELTDTNRCQGGFGSTGI
jgi:dUTP pyrophosphatase